ncbi:MAG: acyltransferase [Lachnospiraceae bacterium]|nr:acyltransferase [Lachnospiraceae bacterium]
MEKISKSGAKAQRMSNIELLRIITALGVIILHYNNANLGGGFKFVEGNANKIVLAFFQACFICAVNLFILISGYFMRHSQKRDLLKPIELIGQLVILEGIFLCINELPNGEALTLEKALSYFKPGYWFVFVYVALYLISPYINIVWEKLTKDGKKVLMAIMIGLFAIYPMIIDMFSYISKIEMTGTTTVGLDGAQAGYTIVNFALMYIIGLFLRDKDEAGEENTKKNSKTVLLLILNILVILIWSIVDLTVFNRGTALIPAWNYYNPFVITEAILFFTLFKNLKIKHNPVINLLATASFPSYLIHMNLLKYFGIENMVKGNPGLLILHIIGCAVAIYIISFIINFIYGLIFNPLIRLIGKRWTKNRKYEA